MYKPRRRRHGLRSRNTLIVTSLGLILILLVVVVIWQRLTQRFASKPTAWNEEKRMVVATPPSENKGSLSCGKYGSSLMNQCFCDPGYTGSSCNETIPIRNSKCRFDPTLDLCWNTPIGRFRAASSTRSKTANHCEETFWESTEIPTRNHDQLLAFDHFASLPQNLGHVVEVGAGPYTKTKLILETRPDLIVTAVTLIDPLLNVYQTNSKIVTSYAKGSLELRNGRVIPTTLRQAPAEDALLSHPPPPPIVDTIILVNTLEHCSNAITVLRNIVTALKPGGIFLFGESFATELQLQTKTDPCHPIQLRKAFLLEYLDYYFHPILPPRTGDSIPGTKHGGVKQSVFAILRKKVMIDRSILRTL